MANTTHPLALRLLAGDPRATPGPEQRQQAALAQAVLERDPPGWWGGDRYEQTNHYTGVVGIAIKAYLDAIGGAKFTLWRCKPKTVRKSSHSGMLAHDDDYEPADPDHPLARVLEQPGGERGVWSMGQECTFLTLQHMLTGNAPAWTPFNDSDKPVRFFALTSALVQSLYGMGVNPQYPGGAYRLMPWAGGGYFSMGGMMSAGAILPAEEVPVFKDPHPWARNMGMSRLQSGAKEIDVLEAITASRWSYFDSGLQLDTVVNLPGADQPTVEQFQRQLVQTHGGARNARKVLVWGGSGMDGAGNKSGVSQLGPPVREMDYGTSYDQAAGVVLAFYRVPKSAAGLTSATNYSGLYAEKQQLREYGLAPYFLRLSNFLSQSLARPWCERPGQYKIEVELPPLGDSEQEEKQLQFDVQQGLLTYNQALKLRNRKPVKDGDVPVSIYLAKLQQEAQPQPDPSQMPPGAPGEADPLAALLGGDTPTGGAVPKPANPDAEGSRPPVAQKAMSTTSDPDGGFLVPPPGGRKSPVPKRRKKLSELRHEVLKALEG